MTDLRLDYLDPYLAYWPVATRPDVIFTGKVDEFHSLDTMPLTKTWSGMEDCVESGQVRHIGVANFSVLKIEMPGKTRVRSEVDQIESSPYRQDSPYTLDDLWG